MSDITISMGLDSSGVVKGVAEVKRSLDEIRSASVSTEREVQRVSKSVGSISDSFRNFGNALKLAATGYMAKQIIDIADKMTLLNARLGLVSTSQDNLNASQARMFEIAQKLRVPLESVGELYVRVSQNAQNLGKSQEQIAKFTETVISGFKISGASTSEAAAATRQLSQAMASGVLRGDEFNSIMENAPRLQKALTTELKVSAGELRKMAENGQLVSTKVFDAILKQAPQLAEEFKKIPPTIGDSFVVLNNSLDMLVANMNTATGGSAIFAKGLLGLADQITKFPEYLTEFATAFLVMGNKIQGVISGTLAGIAAVFAKIKEIVLAGTSDLIEFAKHPFSQREDQLGKALATGITDAYSKAYEASAKEFDDFSTAIEQEASDKIQKMKARSAKLNETPIGKAGAPLDPNKDKKRALDEYTKSLQKNIDVEKAALATLKNSAPVAAKAIDQEKAMAKQMAVSKALIEAESKARDDYEKHLRSTPKLREAEAAAIKKQAEELVDLNTQLKEEQRLNDLVKTTIEETRTPAEQMAKSMEDLQKASATALGRTAEGAEAIRRKMGELRDQVNPMAQVFKDVATSINDSFTNMFESLFSGTKNSFAKIGETIKAMFIKLLAQMATLAIAKPIIIPLLTSLGGAFGLSSSAIGAVTKELGYTGAGGGSLLGMGDGISLGSSITSLLSGGGGNLGMTFARAAGSLGLNVNNAFDIGTSFNAGSGLAGVGGNLLANLIFGGDRGIGATAGGTLGSIAGSVIGNILLPGAGSVIGSLLGSFGGNALGGLFGGGKKPSNKLQDATINLGTGEIVKGGQTGKKFSQENRDAADAITQAVASIAGVLSSGLNQKITDTIRIAVGARSGYTAGFNAAAGVSDTSYSSPEELLKAVTKQLADGLKDVPQSLKTALDKIDFKNVDQALSDLSFALNFDKLGTTVDKVNAAQQALNEIQAQFDELRKTADRLGLSVNKVNEAQQKAEELLRQQFLEARGGDLVDLISPAASAIGKELKNRQDLIDQAKTLGVSTTLITQASDIRLESLRQQLQDEQTLSQEQKDQLATEQQRLETATQLSNRYKSISDNLGKAIINLRLGNNSVLSPLDKLTEAKALFQTTLSSALGGNTDAADQLSSIGDKVVELTKAYNASSTAAADDINMVEAGLRAVKDMADKQVNIQQQILNTAQKQIDAINNASKSIVAAISNQNKVTTANGTFSANNPNEVAIKSLVADPTRAGKRYITTTKGTALSEDELIALYRSVGFTGTPGGGSVSRFFEENSSAAEAFRVVAKNLGIPGFARGGRTPANKPFIVGEGGVPEIMSFNQSGHVYAVNDNGELVNLLMSMVKEQKAAVAVLSTGLTKLVALHEKEIEMSEEELSAVRRASS